jgi:hypothetical protein
VLFGISRQEVRAAEHCGHGLESMSVKTLKPLIEHLRLACRITMSISLAMH